MVEQLKLSNDQLDFLKGVSKSTGESVVEVLQRIINETLFIRMQEHKDFMAWVDSLAHQGEDEN